jgi:ATP-dependent helicase/nuclease subunit A
LLRWDQVVLADGREHLLVAPIKSRTASDAAPTAYDYLRRLEDGRSAHEDERLLYVAATAGGAQLCIWSASALADETKDDGLKAPASGTLLDLLWANTAASQLFAPHLTPALHRRVSADDAGCSQFRA